MLSVAMLASALPMAPTASVSSPSTVQTVTSPSTVQAVTDAYLAVATQTDLGNVYRASRGYVYLLPLVLMGQTLESGLAWAKSNDPSFTRSSWLNTFNHVPSFPTVAFRGVVNANVDTLYSSAWLDVSVEPIVLSLPPQDMPSRFAVFQTMDMWSNVFASPRLANTSSDHCIYAATYKGQLPSGMTCYESPTQNVWLLGRTAVMGDTDVDAVHALQQTYLLRNLSAWQSGAAANAATAFPNSDDPTTPSAAQTVDAMSAVDFFNNASQLMLTNPPSADDTIAVWSLAQIGVAPGVTVTAQPDMTMGMALGNATVKWDVATKTERTSTGWMGISSLVGEYGINYGVRAVVADRGLGANKPEDAVYLIKQRLSGSRRYSLLLSPAPPVDAFWSVTVYKDGWLVADPRYANGQVASVISNRNASSLVLSDNGISIAIQAEAPEDPMANWLPIPASGTVSLTARFYAPQSAIWPDETWTIGAVELVG